jgi:prephenate dehydratase
MGSARIAFQGEHGAFSEEAAEAWHGGAVVTIPRRDFSDVVDAVLSGAAEYGILPAENLIHGSVLPVYDLLAAGGLAIVDEVRHDIRLCLMGVPGAQPDDIRTALSHPVALNQCRQFFAAHPAIAPVAFFDTAGAAREVAERKDAHAAAIAPAGAARRYSLDILVDSVGDRADNQTRFFIVQRDDGKPWTAGAAGDDPCRAVLMVDAAHRPGSLLRVLSPLAKRDIDLTRIESRPGPAAWSYYFFIEATAPSREALGRAIAEIEEAADRLVVLGVMP